MRRVLAAVLAALLLMFLGWNLVTAQRHGQAKPQPSRPPEPAVGIRVANGRLVEAGGNDLVLRGINHGYTWYSRHASAFADIKAAGANSVRVAIASGQRWPANSAADVAGVIAQCRRNRLICVLDVHDTVGLGQQGGAATIDQAVDYWISLRGVLVGRENYVILNLADEPYALDHAETWTADTSAGLRRMRQAGFRHTIIVDAPDWGQDNTRTMRDNARAVQAADPSGNVVFSVHMYGTFDTAAKVRGYLSWFTGHRLPIVVGEFSSLHEYGNPDEDSIMRYCQSLHVGYLGWSWSGNAGVEYLDMVVDFDPSRRTAWGNRFITGVDGLSTTSHEAAVYGSGPLRR